MSRENWAQAVEHFQTPEFLKRSASNKGVRAQQQVVNRGGSCSYSNACFKEDIARIEAFRKANTDRQGVFSSPAVEQQYNALLFEISQQTQASSEASGLTPKDTQNCFEKILGVRRGHIRGIGRKPSTVVSMSDQEQPLTQPPPQSQLEMLQTMLKDPECSAALEDWFRSLPQRNETGGNEESDDDE
ncbi:hypothetical protein Lser_V15G19184 [Lactuca serriola]